VFHPLGFDQKEKFKHPEEIPEERNWRKRPPELKERCYLVVLVVENII